MHKSREMQELGSSSSSWRPCFLPTKLHWDLESWNFENPSPCYGRQCRHRVESPREWVGKYLEYRRNWSAGNSTRPKVDARLNGDDHHCCFDSVALDVPVLNWARPTCNPNESLEEGTGVGSNWDLLILNLAAAEYRQCHHQSSRFA